MSSSFPKEPSLVYFLLLALNIHPLTGKIRQKFPLEMAKIQGAVVAADINDDGKIELIITDIHGNVAAWTPKGEEIWEKHLKSHIPQVVLHITLFILLLDPPLSAAELIFITIILLWLSLSHCLLCFLISFFLFNYT